MHWQSRQQSSASEEIHEARDNRFDSPGGYSAKNGYRKKDGCQIQQARNGREYRPYELLHYSVDGYCAETLSMGF